MNYEKLVNTKEALLDYKKNILQIFKRLKLIYYNTWQDKRNNNETVGTLLNSFDDILDDFSFIEEQYLNEICESNCTKEFCNETRKNLAVYVANETIFGENMYDLLLEYIDESPDVEHYETLKLVMRQSKKVLIDMPKDILENHLNCKTYLPETDEPIDPKTMTKALKVDDITMNDIDELEDFGRYGDFVETYNTPAIIDKSTGKVLQKSLVSYYSINLPDILPQRK